MDISIEPYSGQVVARADKNRTYRRQDIEVNDRDRTHKLSLTVICRTRGALLCLVQVVVVGRDKPNHLGSLSLSAYISLSRRNNERPCVNCQGGSNSYYGIWLWSAYYARRGIGSVRQIIPKQHHMDSF